MKETSPALVNPEPGAIPSSPLCLGNSEGCLRQLVHLQLQLDLPIARSELLHLELLQLQLPIAQLPQRLQLPIARSELLHLELQL